MILDTFYGLQIDEFIRFALAEDIGDGDHTSLATIDENKKGTANVRVKEDGIIAGIEIAERIFKTVDSSLKIVTKCNDGGFVKKDEIIIEVEGNVRSILKAERLVLNCMQRMSGIATLTNKFVRAIEGTNAKILDTRKTTPNFRFFEKTAVKAGGGFNHRFGLFDMILIKDNHVDAAGGIKKALEKAAEYISRSGRNLKIEIETRNLKEVNEVLHSGIADRILLDNFDIDGLKEAVKAISNKLETEASGGITLANVNSYAKTGVDYISVGALTHSYNSLDISMKLTDK